MSRLPNFLIIGAGKSGTTTVYNTLKQHPDIFMSAVKEPNFFALEGQQKINGYDKDDPYGFNFYPWAITDLEAYKNLFVQATHEKMLGEASTMYQYMPKVPQRIKSLIPTMKIIGIFRNPAERLYSRYLHLVRENRAPTEQFEDCFEKGNLWWQKNDLVQEGFYHSHMKKYYDIFPAEQIKVMLYEDLRKDPMAFMREIFEFLEVDPDIDLDMSVQYNVSGKIKNRFVDKLIGQQSVIRRGIEKIAPAIVANARDSKWMQRMVTALRKKNMERAPLAAQTKQDLINRIYKQEILSFQQLINKDLTHWLAV
ncbi:MAG: sulfotransferase [Saprospiraceae bacterium]|nr:sulfotransferase [Saprospiraceae bacterium]